MSAEVWIALIGIAGTIASGVLTSRSDRIREREQWQLQLREQRRNERLEVCERFATMAFQYAIRRGDVPGEDLYELMNRAQLRLPEDVASLAQELYSRAHDTAEQLKGERPGGRISEADHSALEDLNEKREEFIAAAREND